MVTMKYWYTKGEFSVSILDSIKSLFGGNVEGKAGELLQSIVEQVKPLIEKGNLSEAVTGAVANFGDLGTKVKEIVAKIGTASGEAKQQLVSEKNGLVSSMTEKGNALLDSIMGDGNITDTIKALAEKAKALLGKLGK